MKHMKKIVALALVLVSVLAIAAPALAASAEGYYPYLGPDGSRFNIRHGQNNLRVRNLQYMLIYAGYTPGAADGVFGDLTDAAVRAFQRDYSLSADGIVGAYTKQLLWMALDFQAPPECVMVDVTIPSDDL